MSSQQPIAQQKPRHKVKSTTGLEIELIHAREKKFYEGARDKYLSEFTFTVASDLRGLDRLLLLETQMYRAQWMLAAGMDYDLVDLDPGETIGLQRSVKELNNQISEVQRDLGLTKASRDKDNHESVGAYLKQLQIAAKEHGVHREKQLGKALELTKELFALCGAYQRANENERRKIGFETGDQIVDWVMEYMKPEFDSVDEHFRKNQQRFWLRNL